MLAAALGWRLAACAATLPCALPTLCAAVSSHSAAALFLRPSPMRLGLRPHSGIGFTSLAQLLAAAPAAPAGLAFMAGSSSAAAAAADSAGSSAAQPPLPAGHATRLVAAAAGLPAWQHRQQQHRQHRHRAATPSRRLFSSSNSGSSGGSTSSSGDSSGSGGSTSGSSGPGGRRQRVAVGISGGVDSAVAALLLKEQGYDVVGVFMRNWDEGEEVGNQNCSVERDAQDAAAVCRQLGLPLVEADFVSQYWTQVFEEFLDQCGRGLTPNPDLACNRHIKFDALLRFADSLGADYVATGHYARTRHVHLGSPSPPCSLLGSGLGPTPAQRAQQQWSQPPAALPAQSPPPATTSPAAVQPTAAAAQPAAVQATAAQPAQPALATAAARPPAAVQPASAVVQPTAAVVQLLKGQDPQKDQTYFLASIQPQALERVIFPVGGMLKGAVRELAAERGLLPAERRSSAGICFIGRRNFADFLSQYVPPVPGTYVSVDTGKETGTCVSVDTGKETGTCPNILTVTHGQRPGIGGAAGRVYVVGKDVVNKVVYVCQGREHSALLTRTALLRTPHWLSAAHSQRLAGQGWLRCEYKARYGQETKGCTLYPAGASKAAAGPCVNSGSSLGGTGTSGRDDSLVGVGSDRWAGADSSSSSSSSMDAPQLVGNIVPQPGQQEQQQQQQQGRPPVFVASAYTQLAPEDAAVLPGYLLAVFDEPAAAITPQQAFVMYDGEVCLGSAPIAMPGRTLFEEESGAVQSS